LQGKRRRRRESRSLGGERRCVRDLKNQERTFLVEIPYYIYTYCQWRTKREKYLFCNERRGNVRGLTRIYFHAPSKPPRRDIAKKTSEKKKRSFSIPDVKARHGPFFQSECQEQDQQV
jgi:hypothetical protein